ncbi:putative MFS family arabinose efflux permease [Planomicrobium soli]|uniref:Putative MFS family arabinose efflux permease n=1 Tax=Planomicrobium soli TaxID=1176648 RepID=A0A2P8GAX8_9BACL|nr:MFS transporter [Planomicrobium soli]PSL31113.1 putative MFS family arabinose efflux permease [Planomicrobium soli]
MPKRVWLLIIGMLVNVTGNSFLWPLTTIYMHDYLDKSLSVAGLILMVNAAAAIIGNLLGGVMFDRIGGYRSVMSGIVLTTVALAGLTIWHDFMQFAVLYTIIGFSGGIVFPSMYAMVGTVWPEGGRKAFNAIYLAQNVGVAIGPAMAGFLAAYSFDYIFAANLGMYIVFFFIALFGFKSMSISPVSHTSVFNEKKKIRKPAPFYALMIVSAGYLLCWIGYVQWQSTISAYTQQIGITLPQYSLLWTINGLLIVVGQPFIQPVIKRIEDNIKRQLVIGIVIMMISYIVVAFAEEFSMFIAAMVILTIGEMFVWPAVPALANHLAPKGREGFYQGIVNSVATSGRMIGPLFGGLMVDLYGMSALFLAITLLVSVSIATSLLYDYPLKKEKQRQLEENFTQ